MCESRPRSRKLCHEGRELLVQERDLLVVEVGEEVQVAGIPHHRRVALVESAEDVRRLAPTDPAVGRPGGGEAPSMPVRRPVGLVRVEVVEVEEEGLGKARQDLVGARLDAGRGPHHARLVEAVEAPAVAAPAVDPGRRDPDDDARRDRRRRVTVPAQDLGQVRHLAGHRHAVLLDPRHEPAGVARGEDRDDRREGAACLAVDVIEDHRLAGEPLEKRARRPVVPIEAQVVGPQRVDQEHDHVPGFSGVFAGRPGAGDGPGDQGEEGGQAGEAATSEDHVPILAKLRLKPTRRLKRLRRHGPLAPRPRRPIAAALLGTATPDRWIHRMPPASPRSPSLPTGGKGTVDRMPPASTRSPSHPTGGEGDS